LVALGQIYSYNIPSSAQAGSTVNVTITIKNVGDATGNFRVLFDINGVYAGASSYYTLAVNQTAVVPFSFTMPNVNTTFFAQVLPSGGTPDYVQVTITVTGVAKIPTTLTLYSTVTSGVAPLSFVLTGVLYETPTGAVIPDAPVNIYENGVKIATVINYGEVGFSLPLTRNAGTYTYYASYAGSSIYEGCP